MSNTAQRRDPYQAVTDLILEHLERGTVPWRCPWQREVGIPRNFHSGKAYSGINVLLLGFRHRPSPWWLTFQQALERGGHVRKGEKGAMVVKYGEFNPKTDLLGNPQAKASSESNDPKQKKKMFLREYTVFNATQIEGIEFPAAKSQPVLNQGQRIAAAEQIVAAMPNRPVIFEGQRTRAFYTPATDTIHMPAFGSFESAEAYHLTLFHEVIHACGHASRLNRESMTKHDQFGGPVYSQEELVAEIGSAFLGMEADIVLDQHEQSAAYLQSWLQALRVKEHKRWIVSAAAQATKAANYVLDRQPTVETGSVEAVVTA
jgi:antirestriction protein ArdC